MENSVMKERLYLSNMRSPFIVNMIFAFQDLNNLYLGLELMKGGDLRYHLINHSQTFTESQLKFLVSNLILGLEYIHSKNIIHRDIKPENILFDNKGYAYITDFNISCKKEEINNLYDISGTPVYMAPESVAQKYQDFTIDFYSLGIICYECIMGIRPYEGSTRHEVKKYLNENTVEIQRDDRISELCESFINGLLKKNPADRLGANSDCMELKENLFFKGFNWDILKRKKYVSPIAEIISFARSRNNLSDELFDAEFCNKVDEIDDHTKSRYAQIMAHENYPIYFRQYTYLSKDAVRDIALKRKLTAVPPKKTLSYSRSSENISLPRIKGTFSYPSNTNKSNGGKKFYYSKKNKYKSGMNSLKDFYEYKLNKYKQLLRQSDNNNGPQNNHFNYYPNFFPNPIDMNPMNYQNQNRRNNNMNGNDIYNDVCNGLQRKLYRDIFGGMDDDFDKGRRSDNLPNQYQINNYFPPPFMMPAMGMMNPYFYMMPPYGGKNDFFLPKISTKGKHTYTHNSYKSNQTKKTKSELKSKKSEKTGKSKKSKSKKSKKESSNVSGSSEEESEEDSSEDESEKKKSEDDKEDKGSKEESNEDEKSGKESGEDKEDKDDGEDEDDGEDKDDKEKDESEEKEDDE